MAIIGGGELDSGRKFAVTSDGNSNTIHWLDGSEPMSWKGHELSCCTGCGDMIVCPTTVESIYLVTPAGVSAIEADLAGQSIFGACRLNSTMAVAGGSRGTLVGIDLEGNSATVVKASSLGLRKPGHDIINLVPFAGGIAAIGKKELVYIFDSFPGTSEALDSSGNDAFFFNGCEFSGDLWLSGLVGRKGILARYSKVLGGVDYFDTPIDANGRAFAIAAVGDSLVLASADVFVGEPDSWVKRNGFDSPECVTIIPDATGTSCTLLSFKGATIELDI